MLGKKKYILIIIAIFLVNYLLIYLKRIPSTKRVNADIEGDMPKPGESTLIPEPTQKAAKNYSQEFQIPVLVLACNRVIIKRCLDSIIKARNNDPRFPVYVSQDCSDTDTENAIKQYGEIFYMKQPNQTNPVLGKKKKFQGYYKIARHYRWALNQVFERGYLSCIIIEDDLEVSTDIFEYFLATFPILQNDMYIYCVSAWNDNGKVDLIDKNKPGLIHRTDFFPGLGWMLSKKLWLELEPQWPDAFWDDWMRMPHIRKNRSCLRPEISRTETFGKKGVSNGMYFSSYLQHIKKYSGFYPFRMENLSYLAVDAYEEQLLRSAYLSPEHDVGRIIKDDIQENETSLRFTYRTINQFRSLATTFGVMADFKSGIARTAYRGIVSFRYKNHQVYFCPPYDWPGYNVSWN